MKRNINLLLAGILVAVLFVLTQAVFIIRQGEVAVLTRLGRPVATITEPALYRRWPWPVERVYRFDNRTRALEGNFEESLTQDGKNVLLSVFANWRIADPGVFLERVGGIAAAEAALDGLVRTHRNALLGQYRFGQLVNTNAAELKLDELERRILESVQPAARERYGMDVEFVGVRRLGLPETVTQSVFARMKAERQELADRYKSEGEGEAVRIRARADSERDQLLAQAEADARRLRAEGDAAAAEYYQVFEQNPELAMFLRKLEVLEDTLKEKATVVLSADTEPFDLLKSREAAKP